MLLYNYPYKSFKNEGKDLLYFAGTDYLSMQSDDDFFEIVQKNQKLWRISYGSSRFANVKLSVYDRFEKYMAKWIGLPNALSVSSCSLAGILVYEVLKNKMDQLYYVNGSHPSIKFQGSKAVFDKGKLIQELTSPKKEKICITADAVLSGAIAPTDFSFLDQVHPNKEITLLVDESHSIGLLGENGRGISFGITNPNIYNKIVIASMSKALGISGGIIVGSKQLIDSVKSMELFIGASGTNPAFIQSIMDAEPIYHRQRIKLKHNLSFLCSHINNPVMTCSRDYPVIYYPKNYQYDFEANNIITTHFLYGNTPVQRIVIMANHLKIDLEKLLLIINSQKRD
jgi:7-keto-8-aminopelargonate synthetase-like enzyme